MTGAATVGGPIVRKDSAQRIVTAPVLVPGEPDRERHEYRAENIAEVAKSFLPSGEIDAMHAGGEVGHPTESWVAKQDLTFEEADRTIPQGAWMLSAKIADDEVWAGVADGTYQGLSVFGPIARVLDDDGNELDIQEIARPVGQQGGAGAQPAVANSFAGGGPSLELPPAPVGETWTVELEKATHVSIVDDPAVQAASFVVAKSAGSGAYGNEPEDTKMEDELEERLDDMEASIKKDATAAAEDAAETAAEEAVENADPDDGGSDGGGSGGEDLTTEGVRSIVEDTVEDALGDVADDIAAGGDGGSGDGDDPDVDGDLDGETIDQLVDAGVIDEETAEDLGAPATGVEKQIATLEKKIDQLSNGVAGRQGFGTQLDGVGDGDEDDGTDLVSNGDRAAAIKRAGTAGGEGGDDE
ncbi:XkdF-like putative serine protease domain-containing protein [Halococcus saccharolyticus]|uniref:Structural protein n=1 Tax=Halococcus saccharolyticus DSM 5350 TaxID=1227455 RepID=M0ME25_9EURY|nr:XkdF-like putative serine protease domain-containing protein [Halococcus saccharolyticus]EMA42665.1 structural protein [Halococcus saccharolyticus DSM 5350]